MYGETVRKMHISFFNQVFSETVRKMHISFFNQVFTTIKNVYYSCCNDQSVYGFIVLFNLLPVVSSLSDFGPQSST